MITKQTSSDFAEALGGRLTAYLLAVDTYGLRRKSPVAARARPLFATAEAALRFPDGDRYQDTVTPS